MIFYLYLVLRWTYCVWGKRFALRIKLQCITLEVTGKWFLFREVLPCKQFSRDVNCISINFTFSEPCIVIRMCEKDQQHSRFSLIIYLNLFSTCFEQIIVHNQEVRMNNYLFETCRGKYNWNKLLSKSLHLVGLSDILVCAFLYFL
jgi:hypothetical protein